MIDRVNLGKAIAVSGFTDNDPKAPKISTNAKSVMENFFRDAERFLEIDRRSERRSLLGSETKRDRR